MLAWAPITPDRFAEMTEAALDSALRALAMSVHHGDPALGKSAAEFGNRILPDIGLRDMYIAAYARRHIGSAEGYEEEFDAL